MPNPNPVSLDGISENEWKNYRPIPFWSWNDRLCADELRRQILHMKEIGMGGFFMHARGGLLTEYLSDEWFEMIGVCIDYAGELDMNAWCYDENGWPSGFAGMKLLENSDNHVHYLSFETKQSFDKTALGVYALEDDTLYRLYGDSAAVSEYLCVYDNTNSSFVDILDRDIVAEFIRETHDRYYERYGRFFGNIMLGFFTDEPQYFRRNTAYSRLLQKEYFKEYGEDLSDVLAALFVPCKQSFSVRFKYWRLVNRLYTESFAKQVYEWCDSHGCMLTGHTVEEARLFEQMTCCAGVMPFYEYQHIPGIDWLGRRIGTEIAPKQVSSAAQQLGKKQVLTEAFACTGWNVTPRHLKMIAEWQMVNGVNLLCPHLYAYSIRGQRKRDHPVFFSEHNPWAKHLRAFNDYFTTLGYMLANSREEAETAVIHPIHAAYLTFNREEGRQSVNELDQSFEALAERLGAANIGHHLVDESILAAHGCVEGSRLVVGQCHYSCVVVPEMPTIDSATAELLKGFVRGGGRLCTAGRAPHLIDAVPADTGFLVSNTGLDEIENSFYSISPRDTDIRSVHRISESEHFGDFIYLVNLSQSKAYEVSCRIKAGGARLFDIETRRECPLYFVNTDTGIDVPLCFKPGQAYLLLIDDSAASAPKIERSCVTVCGDTIMSVSPHSENALTLDRARISYDNVNFEQERPVEALSEALLRERKNRRIYLKYTFSVEEIPDSIYLEFEYAKNDIWVNGSRAGEYGSGVIDKSFGRVDIREYVKIGVNEVVFAVDYYQNAHVYHVLFDHMDGMESLKNCLTYDTSIEAVYIMGRFGVTSADGFCTGADDTLISGGKFAVSGMKPVADAERLAECGYPFFAGDITLSRTITLNSPKCELRLVGHYAAAEVSLNGVPVKTLLFDDCCDLSEYAAEGDNLLSVTLTSGNRNLLGPFHCATPEPQSVEPSTFDMYGTWKNGESAQYRNSYAFVQFGIKRLEIVYYS